MDIKNFIRKMGYTQSIIADTLGISRPTLDLYIDQFEKMGYVSRGKYDRIFKCLFSDKDISPIVFKRRLESVCDIDKKGVRPDYLSNSNTSDLASRIHNIIIDDVQEGNNEYIYTFIELLLKKYRNDESLQMLAKYYYYLYTDVSVSNINDVERLYFSNFYNVLTILEKGVAHYIDDDFKCFIDKKRKIKMEKRRKKDETVRNIDLLMKKSIDEFEKCMDDPTEEQIIRRMLELRKERKSLS